jgi:hypothetical protein
MEQGFWRFGFFTLVILVGICGLAAAYAQSKKRERASGQRRSLLDYLLVWPLLFDISSKSAKDEGKSGGRLLTNRAIVGWLVVAALIVLAMVFHW